MKRTLILLFATLCALSLALLAIPGTLDLIVGGKYGDGGVALEATSGAWGMLAKPGQLLIADTADHEVRVVGSDGKITRLVGTGRYTPSAPPPVDGPATQIEIRGPIDIVEFEGLLYISETNGSTIRVYDPATGIASVIASGLLNPTGMTIDPAARTLLVGEAGRQRVQRFGPLPCTRECPVSTMVFTGATLSTPYDLYMEADGSLLVLDFNGKLFRSTNGVLTRIAGGGASTLDGVLATDARLSSPSTLTKDAQGNIYIADAGTNRVRKIGLDGIITTVLGNGQGANGWPPDGITDPLQLPLDAPRGVAFDASTNSLFVSSPSTHRIYRVSLGAAPPATATAIATGTATQAPTVTSTSVPPTATATKVPTATPTSTRVATATSTRVSTATATATETDTIVPTATASATIPPTHTLTPAPTCVPECVNP